MTRISPAPLAGSLPERVRQDAAFVMQNAAHVTINHEKIATYARDFVKNNPLITELETENHFVAGNDPALTAAYIFALDSINFGSGVFSVAQKSGVDLEYTVIAQGLKNAFAAGHMTTLDAWARVRPQDCHEMFGIPERVHPRLDTLMNQFATQLQATAQCFARDFGSFPSLMSEYRGRGLDVLERVAAWPHFADTTHYHGHTITIAKRAQILLADLELATASPGQPYFGGLDQLTCFADNMVPHVLRVDGILSYTQDLAGRIDAGALIEAGSEEETELRCAAIHAVELMRASLGGAYTSVNLDHMLWHRGYGPDVQESPHRPHRTISVWY